MAKENEKERDDVLRRMLKTPPKPHKPTPGSEPPPAEQRGNHDARPPADDEAD